MSKEQAIRFMLLTKEDKDLKQKYQGIVNKYKGTNLSEEEQEKNILEEVIALAKSIGFTFSAEDILEFLQPADIQLTDAEMDEIAGGRGRIVHNSPSNWYIFTCEAVPDDGTFKMYRSTSYNNCPYFEFDPSALVSVWSCVACKHYNFKIEPRD